MRGRRNEGHGYAHSRASSICVWPLHPALADSKGQTALLNEDGTPPRFCHWPERGLVQVTEGNPTEYRTTAIDFMADEVEMPEDFCMELVE